MKETNPIMGLSVSISSSKKRMVWLLKQLIEELEKDDSVELREGRIEELGYYIFPCIHVTTTNKLT